MTREHFERLCFGDYVEPRWWDIERLLARVQHVSRGELVKTYPRMRRTFAVADEPQQYVEAMRDAPTLVYNQQTWRRLMRDPWLAAQVRP